MDDFKKVFHLTQQSPHLHFLHRQAGPTLRLTELKAKLDRLIIKHEFQNDFDQAKEYLVGYSHDRKKRDALRPKWENEHFRALDYRLRLEFQTPGQEKDEMWVISTPSAKFGKVIKNETNEDFLGETPYFADNDKTDLQSEDLKKGVLFAKPIDLQVFSFHDRLLQAVTEYLPMLLALENFGCRQSKGFGCYWLEGHNFEDNLKKLKQKKEILGAWVCKRTYKNNEHNDIFRHISSDYRVLKSGFNHPMDPSKYKKSLLFEYFAEGNVRWEKRKIKQEINKARPGILKQTRKDPVDIVDGHDANHWGDPAGSNYDYRYIRALLGLAEQYEFQSSHGDKVKVKINHPEMERFRSPITIKVVNGRIYWLAIDEQIKNITGKVFEFSANQGGTPFFSNIPLQVPTQFSLAGFLQKKLPPIGYTELSF